MKNNYTDSLADVISERLAPGRERQFGFEYEFMPGREMGFEDLEGVWRILEDMGYRKEPNLFQGKDHYITFEPGGQIEFCSIPISTRDNSTVHSILLQAATVNAAIRERIGLEYIPTGFIPGRGSAKMLLDKPRYHNLHNLLSRTGTRGHEMMKGTAAIHLHVGLASLGELPLIWNTVCEMSRTADFAMGFERRHIWDNTDPSRCGLMCGREQGVITDFRAFLEKMTEFGMGALDLATGVPFGELPNKGFHDFLDHLTTLFTDVRINMKGVTLELRTLDSVPPEVFLQRWQQFLSLVQQSLEMAEV